MTTDIDRQRRPAPPTSTPDGAAARGRGPPRRVPHPRRRRQGGQRRQLHARRRARRWPILGESGSGKRVTAQAIMGILDIAARRRSPAARSASAARTCSTMPEEQRRKIRGHRDRDDLPGRAVRAEPGLHRRLPDRRDVPRAPRACPSRTRQAQADRADGPGQDPGRRAAGQRLPAPVLRRHAPARHDRDGARARPGRCSSPTSRPPRST